MCTYMYLTLYEVKYNSLPPLKWSDELSLFNFLFILDMN
ncbi:protein of unknown function [Shewanella benthica]|uniref:Uncharacterized protein n=1 Tax=Shewanella benthica TaxID=43661 RepID=A0A330LY66_9GAMM|nr:protein of unknown function [Shewanella benthica]